MSTPKNPTDDVHIVDGGKKVKKGLSKVPGIFDVASRKGLYLFSRPKSSKLGELTGFYDYILDSADSLAKLKEKLPQLSKDFSFQGLIPNANKFTEITDITFVKGKGGKKLTEKEKAEVIESHTQSKLSRDYYENTILPQLQDEFVRLPYVQVAIKQLVETGGHTDNTASAYFAQEFLDAIRTEAIILAVHVRDAQTGVIMKGEKRFTYAPTDDEATIVRNFILMREENGFNNKLIKHAGNEESKKPPVYKTMSYEDWLQRMNQFRAVGIPINGLLSMDSDNILFESQKEELMKTARNIKSSGDRASKNAIAQGVDAYIAEIEAVAKAVAK